MSNRRSHAVVVFLGALFRAGHLLAAQVLPPTSWVNPVIGTAPNPFSKVDYSFDTGNVFPGAVCPRGMLAWSPDTAHASRIAGGYWYPDGAIEDFSLTHFSGRGVPCLKDIPFMPIIGTIGTSPGTNWSRFAAIYSHTNEIARAGYYRVKFNNGIEVELTATPRTGMARFAFPSQPASTLLIRADSSVSIAGKEVTGYHVGKIGGANRPYTLFFAAQFDRPFQNVKTWTAGAVDDASNAKGKSCGAILTFDTTSNPVVQVRVGISYVSIANAGANLAAENPAWNFS